MSTSPDPTTISTLDRSAALTPQSPPSPEISSQRSETIPVEPSPLSPPPVDDDRVRARARVRQRNRRSQELCVVFGFVALIVIVTAPLALTRKRESSMDMSSLTQVQVYFEELIDIVSDSGHSCAIVLSSLSSFEPQQQAQQGGDVVCWGNQIGVPANLRNVSQIAVGDGFSCAVTEKKLVCWGDDTFADYVQPPLDLGDVTFVTASGGAVCVIDINGIGRCWGMMDLGRVELTLPSSEDGLLRYIAIPKQGDLRHICGIRQRDDGIQCWTTSVGYVLLSTLPLDVEQNNVISMPIESVAVMDDFVCAIAKKDASLHCWTFNNDTEFMTSRPDISSDMTFTAIAAGNNNEFCAIASTGHPVCFGDDGKPKDIPSQVEDVTKLSIDREHTCAILADYGYGICWGTDISPGQLSPFKPNPQFALQMAAGVRMTCAIHIYQDLIDCWGLRRYQLLVGASDLSVGDEVICVVDASDDLTKCVFGNGIFILDRQVRQVRVSLNDVICTIGKLDATVKCYRASCVGTNDSNNNNNNNYNYNINACSGDSDFPGNPDAYIAADVNQVGDLQIGQRHYCVIEQLTHILYCGPLHGRHNSTTTPPETQVPENLLPVRSVALGRYFTCAVQKNYEIVCWGDETKYGTEYVLDPPVGTYYQAIAATPYEACAITLDKFVHCWGRPFLSTMYVPSEVQNVESLVAGSDHFCAHMENKEMICWGSNRYGELSMDYFG